MADKISRSLAKVYECIEEDGCFYSSPSELVSEICKDRRITLDEDDKKLAMEYAEKIISMFL